LALELVALFFLQILLELIHIWHLLLIFRGFMLFVVRFLRGDLLIWHLGRLLLEGLRGESWVVKGRELALVVVKSA
jgi:hypothetical protein